MSVTFVVLVADKPGVLTRVASLVRRRGFNIESLTVGHAGTPGMSRITLVVEADPGAAARIEAHLYRLVDVRSVQNVTNVPTVFRHLALIKVAASAESRSQVMQLVDVFRARVVDVAPDSLIIEITGVDEKIDGLLEILRPFGVLEVAKTGCLAMTRGAAARAAGATATPAAAEAVDAGISFSV
jgi:acetolactate synthase-1/3 small subunit